MNEVESVSPTGDNISDLRDDMMKPFEQEERERDNQEKDNSDQEREDNDEAIGLDEEEGIKVKIGKMEKAPTKEEVAMHMVNHIPFRSWCAHCVRGKAHGNQQRRRKAIEGEERQPVISVD